MAYSRFLLLFALAASAGHVRAHSLDFRNTIPSGRLVARHGFEEGEKDAAWSAIGKGIICLGVSEASVDGSRAYVAEYAGKSDSWNVFLKSAPGLLKANAHYRLSFDYKPLRPWDEDSHAYVFIRANRPDSRWRPAPTLDGAPGEKSRLVYNFLTGEEEGCVISLGIRNRGVLAVDNLTLEELPLLPPLSGETREDGAKWSDHVGVCAHLEWLYFYKTEEQVVTTLDRLAELGVGWVRLTFGWDWFFPRGPDEVDAKAARRAEFIVTEAEKRGIKPLAILIAPPAWASSGDDPAQAWRHSARDIADYERYVRFVGERFKGRVRHWEINNETNWKQFWLSSFDDYLRELRAASRILREIDPGNTILCAGLTDAGLQGLRNSYRPAVVRLLEPANAAAYDAFSLHLYPGYAPEAAHMVNGVVAVMREKGAVKPVWITETGYSVFENRTLEQQAAFTSRILTELTAHPAVGVTFLYNERVKDFESSPYEQGFGLLNTDFTPRPLYLRIRELFRGPVPAKQETLLPAQIP